VIETGDSRAIYSVAFHPDGAHLFSAARDGVRRWRVADGQEVGTQMGAVETTAISVSRDHKWIVCGTEEGACVWNAKTQEKAIEVEGGTFVDAVDISPDSTRFATGTGWTSFKKGSIAIRNILTGERLVGPLQHNSPVRVVRFSPNGERIASVCPAKRSLHVFDSHNGDQLVTINNIGILSLWTSITPLAWSDNQQQIFIASGSNKIESFDVSTGSQLAEWQVHGTASSIVSIALASNGKFLATFARGSTGISFWDTSTHSQIGPVIQDGQWIRSIALSSNCSYLATGGFNGNITIRSLSSILPDSYGPFLVSICAFTTLMACRISYAFASLPWHQAPTQELDTPKDTPQQQQDEKPSTLDVHDKKPPDSTPVRCQHSVTERVTLIPAFPHKEQLTTSGQPESETHREDNDLLEVGL